MTDASVAADAASMEQLRCSVASAQLAADLRLRCLALPPPPALPDDIVRSIAALLGDRWLSAAGSLDVQWRRAAAAEWEGRLRARFPSLVLSRDGGAAALSASGGSYARLYGRLAAPVPTAPAPQLRLEQVQVQLDGTFDGEPWLSACFHLHGPTATVGGMDLELAGRWGWRDGCARAVQVPPSSFEALWTAVTQERPQRTWETDDSVDAALAVSVLEASQNLFGNQAAEGVWGGVTGSGRLRWRVTLLRTDDWRSVTVLDSARAMRIRTFDEPNYRLQYEGESAAGDLCVCFDVDVLYDGDARGDWCRFTADGGRRLQLGFFDARGEQKEHSELALRASLEQLQWR